MAMQSRTGLMCMVYSKALSLSHTARMDQDSSTGSIVNMMQVDVQKFLDFIPYSANLLWSSPLQVLVCVGLLWGYVGVACLAGLATILAILPINMWAMKELEKVQSSNMQFKESKPSSCHIRPMPSSHWTDTSTPSTAKDVIGGARDQHFAC